VGGDWSAPPAQPRAQAYGADVGLEAARRRCRGYRTKLPMGLIWRECASCSSVLLVLVVATLVGCSAAVPKQEQSWQFQHQRSTGRSLSLDTFSGYSLVAPLGSNVLNWNQEKANLLDVRAGLPYKTLTLHATSGLAINASIVRIKLVLSTASSDQDCLPGSAHEAPHVVPTYGPATPLAGTVAAVTPIQPYENKWVLARFPYSGIFEACYFTGSMWRHASGQITVKGANTNIKQYWCVASKGIGCRMIITGLGVRTAWLLTLSTLASGCDVGTALDSVYDRDATVATTNPADSTQIFHAFGNKKNTTQGTFKVCYCPGILLNPTDDICTLRGHFPQLVGLLYATRVTSKQTLYPKLNYDATVNCGGEAAGGCPLSKGLRIKVVKTDQNNDRPTFDALAGCRTAQQALNHFTPANCRTATDCRLEPSILSKSTPEWKSLRFTGVIENHAQKPLAFDFCFCLGACASPASWFKVDQVPTRQIRVVPDPLISNTVTNLDLSGPAGGWTLTGDQNMRELKILFDPEGTATAEDCFLDPMDARAISGHVCYSSTDCQSPTISNSSGHRWRDVKVRFAGMYAICYCDTRCTEGKYWGFVSWHMVAGPSSKHLWSFSRGIKFDLTVIGLGLAVTNRLRITAASSVCGEASAQPTPTVVLPSGPPVQKGDFTGRGILTMEYAYDGMLVTLLLPHRLRVADQITFVNVKSFFCQYCADLVNSRPHKVIRVPTASSIVIPISYPEKEWPDFNTAAVTWLQSNEVAYKNLYSTAPNIYKVCWANKASSSALDFVGDVGSLTIFEPPVFKAYVHITTVESHVVAPIIVAFQTRYDPRYSIATGEMQFKVHFNDINELAPGFPVPPTALLTRSNATQSVCGQIFKELWSNDADGFPMPKGCFHDANAHEYMFLFSARNGLKAGRHYQIVMDARAMMKTGPQPSHSKGAIHLWSMDDVAKSPFGVIEFGPADIDRTVMLGASGSHAQFHAVDGASIVATDPVVELTPKAAWGVPVQIRARAGSGIKRGNTLRFFLWPLTQWDMGPSCVPSCIGFKVLVSGQMEALSCESPICETEMVVTSGVGKKRNVMRLTMGAMAPITDSIKHTIVLAKMRLPTGGFFATAWGAELRAPDGTQPSYVVTTTSLVYMKPTCIGSVVTHPQDGDARPFRGDQGNILYVRLVMGASLWGLLGDDAAFEMALPRGYVCVAAEPAGTNLKVLQAYKPQGRGDIGIDTEMDGGWLFSGQACSYVLKKNGVIYAGSAIFAKVTMNNPVFPLQTDSGGNSWTVQMRGIVGPMAGKATAVQHGHITPFVKVATYYQRNVPVLGKLTDASLTPASFGAGQSRNFLSIFFTTEQGTSDTAPILELMVPSGFGFLPQCIAEALQGYHYSTMSSHRTGLTVPTSNPFITNCEATSVDGSEQLNKASMKLSVNIKLRALTTYGFRIQVFNAKQYQATQHDGFRLTTLSAAKNAIDSTYYTMKFVSSAGDGSGMSFGIYRLPMIPGSFVSSLTNMLPFTETGLPSTIIIFPLRIPFDSRVAVDWRVVAPHGYEWDFIASKFKYRMIDILGVTADLPINTVPVPPTLPPKNILDFRSNFMGSWDRTATYGFNAMIRVPDSTPRSTVNAFFVQFGYSSRDATGRLSGAVFEAPQVRALVNCVVDYQLTNLAGQQNRLLLRLETITSLIAGGGLQIESPIGFIFEERCVLLDNPMRKAPATDLTKAARVICNSQVPFTTNKPMVTISVILGEIRPALYEFMIDTTNPRVQGDAASMSWTLFAYSSIGSQTTADLTATLQGFAIETPMRAGELIEFVNYPLTQRNDHPDQRSFVVLAFELGGTPPEDVSSVLTVKAPLGFTFAPLCEVIAGLDVFGPKRSYRLGLNSFEPAAAIQGCEGERNSVRIVVKSGLLNLKKYAFRLEVFNPKAIPDHNRWTISYAGESTMPFRGYRLWSFTEVEVSASHGARSTTVEETMNTVTIRFRPTNAITSNGFLAITAPFGYRIATNCMVQVQRLNPLKQPVATVPNTKCKGAPQPTSAAEVHITNANTKITALEAHQMKLKVVNPLAIPVDPGTWRIQSYSSKEFEYASLLDIGEAPSFPVIEVFHTLQVAYPFITALSEFLELTFQIILPYAIELGDTLEVVGPLGYDFTVTATAAQHALEFRSCRSYGSTSPDGLPAPKCLKNTIRFAFQVAGIALHDRARVTPLIEFKASTVYPRRTLDTGENVFQGSHKRLTTLLSSKTVPGKIVIPRLQDLQVVRLDTMRAVNSKAAIKVSFFASQPAAAMSITTRGIVDIDLQAKFGFLDAKITGTVQTQTITDLQILQQSNTSVTVKASLQENKAYVLSITELINPSKPGRSLWTFTSYAEPAGSTGTSWLTVVNRRDDSKDFVGPPTINRNSMDLLKTVLSNSFLDTDGTQLLVTFTVSPEGISAGQYVILYAPFGYSFVDRTFKPGDGFPLVSGSVYVRGVRAGDVQDEWAGRAYIIQTRTGIAAFQPIQFAVRVNTPRTPNDLALFETDYASSWRLMASQDPDGKIPSASNDDLFPGFQLKASFGQVFITPEPNGVTPRKHVIVILKIRPKTTVRSLGHGGTMTVRITSPIGFDFDQGCLAVTPNKIFAQCNGYGRLAVLPVRNARLPRGLTEAQLFLTNAGMTPASNVWLLESFVDMPLAAVQTTRATPRQQSIVPGYNIRELIQASVGANTQKSAVTKVFVWFLATHFLDTGGSVEIHAPSTYSLRCNPRVEYISLPGGICKLQAGTTSPSVQDYHHSLILTLTLPGQVIYPNTAYEFAVSAVNPAIPANPNFWGLVMRNPRKEVVDATMTLDGYQLTDYKLGVTSILASSTRATVVNFVRMTITFGTTLPRGVVQHITIMAPSTTQVLCPQFEDISGGGSVRAMLRLDRTYKGTYITHSCQFVNSITLHLMLTKPILAGSYTLKLGTLNPKYRAVRDYWTVQLLGPDFVLSTDNTTSVANSTEKKAEGADWRTANPLLQIQVRGFGISGAWKGLPLAALPAASSSIYAARVKSTLAAVIVALLLI